MNTKMIGAVAALVSAGAFAGTSYETALVTESSAIYEVAEISTPQEQCWEEEAVFDRHENGKRSGTPVIVSTILGGLPVTPYATISRNSLLARFSALCWGAL